MDERKYLKKKGSHNGNEPCCERRTFKEQLPIQKTA